jgi:hypothetical protein
VSIEGSYREAIATWSGRRRVERSASLLSEVREMLAIKILASEPGLAPAEVAKRVAECLYRSDAETLRLLSYSDR